MTNEELKNVYTNILQEFGKRLSQAMEQTLQTASDAMHHKLNVLLNGASLAINAPENPPVPTQPKTVPVEHKKEEGV